METVLIILLIALIFGFAFAVIMMNKQIGSLKDSMGEKIDKNNAQVQESIGKQLEQSNRQLHESNKVVADISARIATITETNKHVVSVADELKTLQNVLQNPKQRGVFGEFYLDSVLGNVLPPGAYQLQHKFKDGEIVDAVILLDKGKILPVDSKFSLENYNRMIDAKDKASREQYAKKVRDDLKTRIDETSKYIRPAEKTMDFAFMFIPSESLYYDVLMGRVGTSGSSQRDLVEYAFRDRKVIIVSPTSFMAYLQTVLQGLRSLQIEKEALAIQARVAKLGDHITGFETYMDKLGNSLGTTVSHFNSAHKSLEQIDKDVVKITSGEPTIEPKRLDKPQE
ncbi:DNA recombination protein RmuC [Candidatus Saccharibacteria bacterium]|nr:DNA recombination protein RmuC [Candidatus Saccharibacteria bacterium]